MTLLAFTFQVIDSFPDSYLINWRVIVWPEKKLNPRLNTSVLPLSNSDVTIP